MSNGSHLLKFDETHYYNTFNFVPDGTDPEKEAVVFIMIGPLMIKIKREHEGVVIDVWHDDNDEAPVAEMAIDFN